MPAVVEQAKHMKKILQDYTTSVGLRINFQKSTLVAMNTSDSLTKQLADTFGCTVGQMSSTYLGLPIGTTRPVVSDLVPLVASVE